MMMNKIGLLKLSAVALLMCTSLHVSAKLYMVDVVLFTPKSTGWLKEESFGSELPDAWNWINLAFPPASSNTEDSLEAPNGSYNPLPKAEHLNQHSGAVKQRLLANAESRLVNSGQYRVLYQAAFVQSFKDLSQSTRYWVQSDAMVNGQPEMAGWFTFYRGRFLHVKADILLSKGSWQAQVSEPLPEVDTSSQAAEDKQPKSTFLVQRIPVEHRQKLKSGETYYLDHPGIGILIKLTPLGT